MASTLDRPSSLLARAALVAASLVLLGGVLARTVGLSHLPGINGDEAFFGLNVETALAGGEFFVRTPTGNPINPFYSGVLLLEQLVRVPPSFFALRFPALLSGLLLLALSFPLLRRRHGDRAALLSTLVFAALPGVVVYARLGWDPSQSPLAGLLCLAAAFEGSLLWTAVAFGSAVIVHPTNVFLAPVLAGVFAPSLLASALRPSPTRKRTLVLVGLGAAAAIAFLITAHLFWPVPHLSEVGHRLLSLTGWRGLVKGVVELFAGVTSFTFVAGPPSVTAIRVHDAIAAGLLLGLAVAGPLRFIRRRDWKKVGLFGGIAAALVALYLVDGTHPFGPGDDRYAQFLYAPVVLAAALTVDAWVPAARTALAVLSVSSLCALMLFSVGVHFFGHLLKSGGTAHLTFRTGPVEPKLAALEAVRSRITPSERVLLLVDDWWDDVPLRYLAFGTNVVVKRSATAAAAAARGRELIATKKRGFAVGFVDSIYGEAFPTSGEGGPVAVMKDYAGRPVLLLWELDEKTMARAKK